MAKRRSRNDEAPPPPSSVPAPIGLDEVLGQARAIEALDRAMSSSRIHHAWIFHGPPGVGKFTTALAFAAVLLDPSGTPDLTGRFRPDPGSETAALLRAGAHPDLHVITKELAASHSDARVRARKQLVIPVDVVRDFMLEPAAVTRSVSADSLASKVFIVDEAELLSGSAPNAMLKTLEEPPAGTVIILVTSLEHRLLPTIRSRCQRVSFGPLDDASMASWLSGSGLDVSGPERDWVIGFASGSPGKATLAIDNGLYVWHERLSPMLDAIGRGRFPPEMGGEMASLIEDRVEATIKKNKLGSKEAANKAWCGRMFFFVSEWARGHLVESDPVVRGRAMRAIDAVADAERQLGANVNLKLVLEELVAEMAAV